MKRLQRSLTAARASSLCMFGRADMLTISVGRMLTAHVEGVHRCGSVWACPVCAPVVRQRRAIEIDTGLRSWLTDPDHSALFVTLTTRHGAADPLAGRLSLVAQSLNSLTKGAAWERRRDALGYVGAIKAVEITLGANGWHSHAHIAVLFDQPSTAARQRDFKRYVFDRWSLHVRRAGFGEITFKNGVDVRPIALEDGSLGEYLTKLGNGWTPGLELARGDAKRKGRTPFDLLRDTMLTGDKSPADQWREYERATFGKRAIVMTRGLRKLILGTDVEETDEALAASEGVDLALLRALVPKDVWNELVRDGRTGGLLTHVEQSAAVLIWLADFLGNDLEPIGLPRMDESTTRSRS